MRRRANTTLGPLRMHTVASDFLSVYRKTWDTVVTSDTADPRRVLSLRPSQLPFCPVGFFVDHAMRGMGRSLDMAGGYYTQVGTTVHTVMQQYLPQSGRFLANYKCHECGQFHKLSHKYECCDFPTEYHEVEISWKGVVGHIDGIYKDKNGDYWILDFKTTSTAASKKKQKDPGTVYTEQVEAYAYFLKMQYGITVKGVMLVFVIRDNPMRPVVWAREITKQDRIRIKNKFIEYRKMHAAAIDADNEKDALALVKWGRCTNPYCDYCSSSMTVIKSKIKQAVKRGLVAGHVPIRGMADKALAARKGARSK